MINSTWSRRSAAMVVTLPLVGGTLLGATSSPAAAVPADDRIFQTHGDPDGGTVTDTYDGNGGGVTRVAEVPGGNLVRSVSDDGKRIAYSRPTIECFDGAFSDVPACTDFLVKDLTTGREVTVATRAYEDAYDVRLSPDGSTFFYFRPTQDDELRKVLHRVPVDDPQAVSTVEVQGQTDLPVFGGRALNTDGGVRLVEVDGTDTVVRDYTPGGDARAFYDVLSTAPVAGKALLSYRPTFDSPDVSLVLLDVNTGVFTTWLNSSGTRYALDGSGADVALAPDAGAAYLRSDTKDGSATVCGQFSPDLLRVTPDGAITVLPVPCGAGTIAVAGPAGTPSDPADTPPSLTLSPTTISAGQVVTVTYRGEPGATLDILSRTQPATTFSKIGTVTLDGNGVGTSTHKPQRNTRITALSPRTGMSQAQPIVGVRSVTSLNAKRVGTRTYTFTGRAYPALRNRLVNIYRNNVLVAQARCDASGIYTVTKTLAGGTYTFQARTPNDTYNVGSNSRDLRTAIS